jgi:nitrite reductase/ring-hydroxylating ferredoxin subunit
MREPKRYVACPVSELQPGTRKIVTIRGREIGVFNFHGKFYAVNNSCPHHQAPLCIGQVTPEMGSAGIGDYELKDGPPILSCPWHSYEFNMETGANLGFPDRYRVKTYQAKAEGDDVVIYI